MAAARRIQLTLRLHSSIYVPLASLNDKLSLLFSWDITRADDPTDASSHARCGMATNDAVWEELLAWITEHNNGVSPAPHVRMEQSRDAGRGLVAVSNIEPDTLLLSIPARCLLNRGTLAPLYPAHFQDLTSTQWISLHLAVQRNRHTRHPSIPTGPIDFFKPFLNSLPTEFPTVPLTWSIGRRTVHELETEFSVDEEDLSLLERIDVEVEREDCRQLCDVMPVSIGRKALDVERRFKEDWLEVKRVWALKNDIKELLFFDYLLAWLNVNTRCVYYTLPPSYASDLTLAPIIDIINHNPSRTTAPRQQPDGSIHFSSPSIASGDDQLGAGCELFFSYGAHEDTMLFTEYGFTLDFAGQYDNIEIDDEIEALFEAQGLEGQFKRDVLRENYYWGDMTLQANPRPPYASFRVLVALRLLWGAVDPWLEMKNGERELISGSNEREVELTIEKMCAVMAETMKRERAKCAALWCQWESDKDESEGKRNLLFCLNMLNRIWTGEEAIRTNPKDATTSRASLPLRPFPSETSSNLLATLPPILTRTFPGDRLSRAEQADLDRALLLSQQQVVPQQLVPPTTSASIPTSTVYPTLHGTLSNSPESQPRAPDAVAPRRTSSIESLSSSIILPHQPSTSSSTLSKIEPVASISYSPGGTDDIQPFPTYRPRVTPMDASFAGSEILDFSDASIELKAKPVAGMSGSGAGAAVEGEDTDMILEDSENERAPSGEMDIYASARNDSIDIIVPDSWTPPILSSIKRPRVDVEVGANQQKTAGRSTSAGKKVLEGGSPAARPAKIARAVADSSEDEGPIVPRRTVSKFKSAPSRVQDDEGTDYDEPRMGPSKPVSPPVVADAPAGPSVPTGIIVRLQPVVLVSVPAKPRSISPLVVSKPNSRRETPAVSEDEEGNERLHAQIAADAAKALAKEKEEDGYGRKKKKGPAKKKKKKETIKKDPGRFVPARRHAKQLALDPAALESTSVVTSDSSTLTSLDESNPAPKSSPVVAVKVVASKKKRMVIDDDEDEDADNEVESLPIAGPVPRDPSPVVASIPIDPVADPTPPILKKKSAIPLSKKGKGRAVTTVESDSEANFSDNDNESDGPSSPKRAAKGKGKAKAVVAKPVAKVQARDVESRMAAVMDAAVTEEDALGVVAESHRKSSTESNKDTTHEDVSKENEAPSRAVKAPTGLKGLIAKTARSSGLARVIESKGLWGAVSPGLSKRSTIPRLHQHLKPAPPPPPALPKERPKPKKKGDESYSDEERPWYETKHPEEWDSDDNRKWSKIQKRREAGFDSD